MTKNILNFNIHATAVAISKTIDVSYNYAKELLESKEGARQFKFTYYVYTYRDAATFVDSRFLWKDTVQGPAFWADINIKLFNKGNKRIAMSMGELNKSDD